MNSRLASLQPSLGEPQHAAPAFVLEALKSNLRGLSSYPVTKGSAELRRVIVRMICAASR
jgi:N-succinyldiaminopimelate aminotransferase